MPRFAHVVALTYFRNLKSLSHCILATKEVTCVLVLIVSDFCSEDASRLQNDNSDFLCYNFPPHLFFFCINCLHASSLPSVYTCVPAYVARIRYRSWILLCRVMTPLTCCSLKDGCVISEWVTVCHAISRECRPRQYNKVIFLLPLGKVQSYQLSHTQHVVTLGFLCIGNKVVPGGCWKWDWVIITPMAVNGNCT